MSAKADPLGLYRRRLEGLAYRMLGSRVDAEDVLQDAYLRFRNASAVDNEEAYLTTMVTRLCLDRLKSARARRETYVGAWLPEPFVDIDAVSPQAAMELADDLSFALMLALDRLSPPERASFLLHDIFDMNFADIAAVLDKSEAACRQLASRARRAVRAARPAVPASSEAHVRLLVAFTTAVASGDVTGLTMLLREDAVMISDGGGIRMTALNPIRGAERIARYFIGTMRKFGAAYHNVRAERRLINGELGLVTYLDGVVDQTLSIAVDGDRIAAIYAVRNPEKLTGLSPGSS